MVLICVILLLVKSDFVFSFHDFVSNVFDQVWFLKKLVFSNQVLSKTLNIGTSKSKTYTWKIKLIYCAMIVAFSNVCINEIFTSDDGSDYIIYITNT